MMKNNAAEIGLSEETLVKIDAAIEKGTAEEDALRDATAAAVSELNDILSQNLPKEEELLAAARKVGETASKSREVKMKGVIEMRSLLTAEQLEKFMALRKRATRRR